MVLPLKPALPILAIPIGDFHNKIGHTQTELAEILGSRASEILSRQRALTTEMIYRIHNAWKIPPELLIKQ